MIVRMETPVTRTFVSGGPSKNGSYDGPTFTRTFVWVIVDWDETQDGPARKASYSAAAFIRNASANGKASRISSGGSYWSGGKSQHRVCYSVDALKKP